MTFTPSAEDRERFDSQKSAVLDCLQSGESITHPKSRRCWTASRAARA
ncbi:MAG: hypothetical protein ACOX5A_09185 [Aminivibrio sp.]|jgi:hypothetical protein